LKSLLGTKVEWLYYILEAFNSGDLIRSQELCHVHAAPLNAQPALVANEKRYKMMMWPRDCSRVAEDRTIPLSIIAERTKHTVEDVEYLLMKSLSACIDVGVILQVHLIEGIIDQVDGTVHVLGATKRFGDKSNQVFTLMDI
nr:26S proteasome non-ATPase regulatory subunit 13 homolog A [Tanacetum cinerariifolium]